MKRLSLQQAMLGMRIVQTDGGMIIKSPAGSAEYDLRGRRTKVNGYPEYFPGHLRVKDKRRKQGSMEMTREAITVRDADGSVRFRLGSFENPSSKDEQAKQADHVTSTMKVALVTGDARTALEEIDKQIRNSDAIKISVGESFINGSFIQPGTINSANNIQITTDVNGQQYAAGMRIGVEDDKSRSSKTRLSNEMVEAILDAVRERDLVKGFQTWLDANGSTLVTLQTAINDAATAAIRNALQPGGLIWNNRGGR